MTAEFCRFSLRFLDIMGMWWHKMRWNPHPISAKPHPKRKTKKTLQYNTPWLQMFAGFHSWLYNTPWLQNSAGFHQAFRQNENVVAGNDVKSPTPSITQKDKKKIINNTPWQQDFAGFHSLSKKKKVWFWLLAEDSKLSREEAIGTSANERYWHTIKGHFTHTDQAGARA